MVLPIALAADGPRVPRMVEGFWCLADWNKATRQVIELIRHCLEQGILKHPARFVPVLRTGKIGRIDISVVALHIELSETQWFEVRHAYVGRDVPSTAARSPANPYHRCSSGLERM